MIPCQDRLRIELPGYNFLPGCPDTFARILPGYNPPVSRRGGEQEEEEEEEEKADRNAWLSPRWRRSTAIQRSL